MEISIRFEIIYRKKKLINEQRAKEHKLISNESLNKHLRSSSLIRIFSLKQGCFEVFKEGFSFLVLSP